ncbi:MAG: GNAT family N-acetyltransferase [Akkermansiaceae bacterium]
MNIAPVTNQHKTILFNIHETCFRHHIEEIWGWDDMWQWDYFCKEWDQSKWRLLLENDQVIGYLCWTLEPEHLYLKNISLIPEYQGRGLGKLAMKFIQDLATKNNLPIKLSVFRSNKRVQKFYENLGFKISKVLETGVRMTKPHE